MESWFERLPESAQGAWSPMPQYLVVQWEAIPFLPWIQYFGSWDFNDRTGQPSRVEHFSQPLELDLEVGSFIERSGRQFDLSSADLLDESGSTHYDFPRSVDAPHLVIRLDSSDTYLLDDRAYQSTS